jgi:beta-galactosidase
MKLPEGAEDFSWYGNGPVETFNDRKTNSRQGIWSSTVSEQFYPYMKADDTGNLTDVKWLSLRNKQSENSLFVAVDGTAEASAIHFTPQDLQKADHVYKLSPRKETYLSVDYGSMGTGSATCGQATLDKYRLPSGRTYSWSYTLMPAANTLSNSSLTDIAAQLRSDGTSIQDKSHNKIVVPVGSGSSFKQTSSGNAVSGSVTIPAADDLNGALSGKKSFTVEANFIPTGNPQFNMIASKGDHAFGLRTENNMLYFFIHAGGAWRTVSYSRSTDTSSGWIGQKHQLAGSYDAENDMIRIYCDGKMVAEKSTGTTEGVTLSGYDVTLGACPETGRGSQADFYEFRVYSKALTESELASKNTSSPAYSPDSRYVQLWLDFDNIAESALIGDVNLDGSVNIADAVVLQNYLLGRKPLSADSKTAADMDCNGKINVFDIMLLKRLICSK